MKAFWKLRLLAKWLYKHSLCYIFGALWGYCKICGKREVPCRWVSDKLWTEVTGYPSDTNFTCCIVCFDRMARRKNIWLDFTTNKE